jgi:hypothetical protein
MPARQWDNLHVIAHLRFFGVGQVRGALRSTSTDPSTLRAPARAAAGGEGWGGAYPSRVEPTLQA